MLDYAIVVATRNRLEMLRACIPILLSQTRPAGRIVIVDRSDDHGAVGELCNSLRTRTNIALILLYGSQANLPAQRNQGIDEVTEDVIIFPDDDVLWHPDTAQRFMEVYEADVNKRYGAVSGVDIYTSPLGSEQNIPRRETRLTDHPHVMRVRNSLEALLVPQPFELYGAERTGVLSPPARADGLPFPLVSSIGGYRMSFRTDVARNLRFDQLLGSRIGYAVHEDKDMGLRVLESGHLIAVAPSARVYHNVHPSKRANGYSYGFFHVLNYVYICRKVFPENSDAHRATRRYLRYKVALYATRFNSGYNREVFGGAKAALAAVDLVMTTSRDELPARYAEICERDTFL